MTKRDSALTSKIMASIKSKDTAPEKALGKALWDIGLRYRKQYNLIGKPDFVFVKKKIAVFCDGDFWHGNNWRIRGLKNLEEELNRYDDFWAAKIKRNICRDKIVVDSLREKGWLIFRFWESEIKKSPITCAKKVFDAYSKK